MNRILVSFLIASSAMTAFAQGGTNSPYSQFGLGEIAQQGVSQNRGMDGLGIALHSGNQVNTANPASYAYVDSLTMLFDMGLEIVTEGIEDKDMAELLRELHCYLHQGFYYSRPIPAAQFLEYIDR